MTPRLNPTLGVIACSFVFAYLFSSYCHVRAYLGDAIWVGCWKGCVRVGRLARTTTPAIQFQRAPIDSRFDVSIVPDVNYISSASGAYLWNCSVPLWIPYLFGVAGYSRMLRRRSSRGGCPSCSYSEEGLPSGARCPECGGWHRLGSAG